MRISLITLLFFLSAAILQAQHLYPKGKYHTISQLVHDSLEPNSPCDVYVKGEGLYTQYVIYDSISGKKIASVLAYSDATDLYLNEQIFGSGQFYVKSLEKGRYYYFEGMYSSKDNTPAILGTLLLGVIGGVVIYGITPKDNPKHPMIDFTDVPSNRLCGLIFDTQTGNFTGLSAKNIERVFAADPEIVSYFSESRKKIEDIRRCVQLFNEKYK